MEAISDLEKAVELNPSDWTLRTIYADWLEEHGKTILSEGQRWQSRNEKYPSLYKGLPYVSVGIWLWGNLDDLRLCGDPAYWASKYPCAMLLLDKVFKHLKNDDEACMINTRVWRYYKTMRAAENELARVLAELETLI